MLQKRWHSLKDCDWRIRDRLIQIIYEKDWKVNLDYLDVHSVLFHNNFFFVSQMRRPTTPHWSLYKARCIANPVFRQHRSSFLRRVFASHSSFAYHAVSGRMFTTSVMSGACKPMVSLHARVYNSTRDAASSCCRQVFNAVRMSVLKSVRFIDAY